MSNTQLQRLLAIAESWHPPEGVACYAVPGPSGVTVEMILCGDCDVVRARLPLYVPRIRAWQFLDRVARRAVERCPHRRLNADLAEAYARFRDGLSPYLDDCEVAK